MTDLLPLLLQGAWVTVQVTFWGSLLAIAFWLPVPFVKLSPGPTFNVIGQDDGEEVIRERTWEQSFPRA